MPQVDSELFDRSQFQAELALKASPIAAFKKVIRKAREVLDARFLAGQDIRSLIEGRAWFVDQILRAAWGRFDWSNEAQIALVAVGGYGRGELHPYSDIDLLILLDNNDQEIFRDAIERFLTLLWDIGLEVGQSVRSVQECAEEARADLTVITNLMESRTIAGPERLRQNMLKVTSPSEMWPSKEFFLAKRNEQATRHSKYNNTEYNLEPNVKGSPGGLRDIQTILWIARRQFGSLNLSAILDQGFLTEGEYSLLVAGQEFIWRVRYGLHMLAGRAEDRLLFDHQRSLAALLGYEDSDAKLAIERFMQKYYRVVMSISELSDLVGQHFAEVILWEGDSGDAVPLNSRFLVRDGYLEVADDSVFKRRPFAILEIFVLLAQHPDIQGVRAETIRLLRDHRHLIDDEFRSDIRNTSLFIELFKCKEGIHRNLRRMNRYGILGRYLPEFGHIVGQMQHDLFHIYTVDAHTLNVIKYLRKLSKPGVAEKYPLASKLVERLPKPELIYIAGLYHDIAKGRGGDHSELGAVDAQEFCVRHKLPAWDTRLVVWLVENHLVMSTTAQRKDLSDPQVINDFAQQVGDETHLDYLYVLTVADINATNPTLWNSWRASLLRQLYTETKRALKRGLENPLGREEQIRQTQRAALDSLVRNGTDPDDAEQLWSQLGDDYFMRHSSVDVAWHTEAIIEHPSDGGPLVLIKETTQREFEGGTQIFIYAPDQHDFFAVTVAAMDQLNLNIHDARIITSSSQFTLDTYIVLDADGSPIGNDPERTEEIRQGLITALRNPADYLTIIQKRVPRQLKHFAFPPQVTIHNDMQRPQTIIEVVAPDRPGLLARIGQLFLDFDLSVQNAKIATLGERVEDVFFVTNADNQPLSDPQLCTRLQQAMIKQLTQDNEHQPSPSSIVI
ncbi:MAG: [protein-PII] uridylyltransferase [Gammaproteobacteria bacterium]|jgi:[protein-PII] uridylyltransferase|uniref:[protein-PII] uridylyltransferase n=1 Tax=Stutzerimonas xanthomarina TaxID=271420 RepID=UPI000E8FFC6A|nr:[protein-PII] uridylyltransferase [Stutzerimonas xanthomarina]MBU0810476.1 [protein-PII] uridylyltransferase [Gammaproteobacteria bacterium]HAW26175.1 [protein-PII] uridylyltransferase [Pseudomonas sp.]MBK3846976.1 [protein-PII] uridylyltransferase [Stutzerimonas xanthomarina]MBU1300268.1 [protein-PII] uridylyltransferase [Gammaproteobacteria bacterium]MBU1459179.1 [protein-PII] uridylyltransferase [Gammaproteobacteria bacterium]|tara:strand:+ start:49242 stop:51944 length:2703 start_codon:yes stop_codon:yes gene_type:complete